MVNLNRKQISTLQRIHREAYRQYPMMPLKIKAEAQTIVISAENDEGYPDGAYKATWIMDDSGGAARTRRP